MGTIDKRHAPGAPEYFMVRVLHGARTLYAALDLYMSLLKCGARMRPSAVVPRAFPAILLNSFSSPGAFWCPHFGIDPLVFAPELRSRFKEERRGQGTKAQQQRGKETQAEESCPDAAGNLREGSVRFNRSAEEKALSTQAAAIPGLLTTRALRGLRGLHDRPQPGNVRPVAHGSIAGAGLRRGKPAERSGQEGQ